MTEPKVVGRRRACRGASADELEGFFRLGIALRPTPHLVPRGVYRFRSFEEAQEWMNQKILETLRRRSSPDLPP